MDLSTPSILGVFSIEASYPYVAPAAENPILPRIQIKASNTQNPGISASITNLDCIQGSDGC